MLLLEELWDNLSVVANILIFFFLYNAYKKLFIPSEFVAFLLAAFTILFVVMPFPSVTFFLFAIFFLGVLEWKPGDW